MPSWRQAILLTILGFLLIAAAVGLTMWYAVYHLGVDHAYWLVPILGAAGGTWFAAGKLRELYLFDSDPRTLAPDSIGETAAQRGITTGRFRFFFRLLVSHRVRGREPIRLFGN